MLYLVESRICPAESKGFKHELGNGETFETEFIGASEEDCQKWERENSDKVNFINPALIAIADARTAKDQTLLIQLYQLPVLPTPENELPWPEIGEIPTPDKENTWWSYRVSFKDAPEAILALGPEGIDENDLPYYGLKDRLTDENGVFNVAKARRISMGEDYEAVLSEDSKAS
jgi:hypothetical protein